MRRASALALQLSCLLAACSTTPYTHRHRLMLVSEDQDVAMGKQAFAEVKAKEPISHDSTHVAAIDRVGQRLAQAADKPDYNWEFTLIDDPKTVNAFCLPGGKVAVYSGLLPIAKDDTGLAVVMGHEISHALARHGAERMSQAQLANVGGAALSIATGNASPAAAYAFQQAYGVGVGVGILLPYSRKQESEADHIGLILMAKAGYDPRRAVDFWQRMSKAAGSDKQSGLAKYLSTHPADDQRIKDIQSWIPEALKYYQPPNPPGGGSQPSR
jgi:predicted Zn-dependent protease